MTSQEGSEPTLEVALDRIEEIARELDRGDLELEAALALYEEGVRLMRAAETLMGRAEERILQLRRAGEEFRVEPLAEER